MKRKQKRESVSWSGSIREITGHLAPHFYFREKKLSVGRAEGSSRIGHLSRRVVTCEPCRVKPEFKRAEAWLSLETPGIGVKTGLGVQFQRGRLIAAIVGRFADVSDNSIGHSCGASTNLTLTDDDRTASLISFAGEGWSNFHTWFLNGCRSKNRIAGESSSHHLNTQQITARYMVAQVPSVDSLFQARLLAGVPRSVGNL